MNRFKISLVGRLAGAIAILILIPATLMTANLYQRDRKEAIDKEIRHIRSYSRDVAVEIDSYIIAQQNIARLAVVNREILDFVTSSNNPVTTLKFNEWLNVWSGISQSISEFYILNEYGICIASTDPAFISNDYSIRSYFKEAIQGRHFVSDWTVGITSRKAGIYLSSPIVVPDSRIGGVLVVKLSTDPIDTIIQRSFGLGMQVFVVNNAGVLVAHYDPALRYSSVGDLTQEENKSINETRQFADIPNNSLKLHSLRADIKNSRPRETRTSAEYRFQGGKKIAALTGTSSQKWVVGVTVPLSLVEATANLLLSSFIKITVLVLFFVLLSAFYVSRFIVKPLGNLLKKANLLKEGDYSVQAEIAGDDEVAQLAKAFNSMASQIRTDKEGLEANVMERTAELQRAYEEIKKISITDALTGCYNRHYLEEHLQHEFQRSVRYNGNLSIIMCDIDHFKKVNDTWGHQAGDQVLVEVGALLREGVRQDVDWVARYGGEEFVIVLPETSMESADALAERIRSKIENMAIAVNGEKIQVTSSFGLTALQMNSDPTPHTLLGRADNLLYKAKQNGRNRVITG